MYSPSLKYSAFHTRIAARMLNGNGNAVGSRGLRTAVTVFR